MAMGRGRPSTFSTAFKSTASRPHAQQRERPAAAPTARHRTPRTMVNNLFDMLLFYF